MSKTKSIAKWLNSLMKPRKRLKGNAICPWLKHYRNQITIVETNNYTESVRNACHLMGALGLEAVVIYGKNISYDRLERNCRRWNEIYSGLDREILFMHPDTVEPPLPLEYNFKDSPVVIVQKRSTLLAARKESAKNTNYYTIYGKSNK